MARDRKHRAAIPGVLVIVLALISATATEPQRNVRMVRRRHADADENQQQQQPSRNRGHIHNRHLNVNHNYNKNANKRSIGSLLLSDNDFQSGVEELLLYGSELRAKILDTLGTLVYDHYDKFSIDQLEALYKVYHDTLRRKYNIFDVAPKLKWQRQGFKSSVLCKTVLENICSCIKDSWRICRTVKTANYRRRYSERVSKNARNVSNFFPGGITLARLLKNIQKGWLKITPYLLSGLLLNVPYNNFNNEVHQAERTLVNYLDLVHDRELPTRLTDLKQFKTIDDFLKALLDDCAEQFPEQARQAAHTLAQHVQRDTNSISENIENFGITYENRTIDLKYLFELVIPNDLVDSDIIEARDYLGSEMARYNVVNRYLWLDKYEHATPDQLLLEILRQMKRVSKKISFPTNVISALATHADFWRKDRTIENVADFINLFRAYDNLIGNPKFNKFFELATSIQNKLSLESDIHLELTCTMPRPCLHRVLVKILDCGVVDDDTNALISQFMEQLDPNGRPTLLDKPFSQVTISHDRTLMPEGRSSTPSRLPIFSSSKRPKISKGYSIGGPLKSKPKKPIIESQTDSDENDRMTTTNFSFEESTTPKLEHRSTNTISTYYPVTYNRFSTNIPETERASMEDQDEYYPLTTRPKWNYPRGKSQKPNKVRKFTPQGKSSTNIPNPNSMTSKEITDESTTLLPQEARTEHEDIGTITTGNPNAFTYESTPSLMTEVTEPTISTTISTAPVDETTTSRSGGGASTELPSEVLGSTVAFEKTTIFSPDIAENVGTTTTDSGICNDTEVCGEEACEGPNCIEDNNNATTKAPISEECSDATCEQSSEKPCSGPNCTTTPQSVDCQDAECSTPVTPTTSVSTVPTTITVPTTTTTTISPVTTTEVSTTTGACTGPECLTSENCDKENCSSETTCSSGNCADSTEKCEGPDCPESSNNVTNRPVTEPTDQSLIGEGVTCDYEDCLPPVTSSPSCEGPNCNSTETVNPTTPCYGPDCQVKSEECDGKNCAYTTERPSTTTPYPLEDNHMTVKVVDEPKSGILADDKLCISEDPHRKRKIERLQNVRKITALLAEQQDNQVALLDSNERNQQKVLKYMGYKNLNTGLRSLIRGLKSNKSLNKRKLMLKVRKRPKHRPISRQSSEEEDDNNVEININQNINARKRKSINKNRKRFQRNRQDRQPYRQRIFQKQLKGSRKHARAGNSNRRAKTMPTDLPLTLRAYKPNAILN